MVPSISSISSRGSFGTVLSRWKNLDSETTKDDRTSLVAMAARRWRRAAADRVASRDASLKRSASIRVFQSKHFQRTISKCASARDLSNKTLSSTEDVAESEIDWSECCSDEKSGAANQTPFHWIANRSMRTRKHFNILKRFALFSKETSSASFHDQYEIGQELGTGAYAVVHKAQHKPTGQTYAVKIISTATLGQSDLDGLYNEMAIMAQLQHPHLVGLHELYKVGQHDYHIVMEYIQGGELLDRIVQKEVYNEKETRTVCRSLFQALAYCHAKEIAHRDLKPENLLLVSQTDDSNVKIADFGFAKKCPASGFTTLCGTPNYVAPEIIWSAQGQGAYGIECDNWSLGVIVYILLGGYCPFETSDERTLFRLIQDGTFEFHEEYWAPVSEDAKGLIQQLLQVDEKKRLTAADALQHAWLTADDSQLEGQDLSGSTLQALKKFNAKRKFRAAVNTLIAAQRMSTIGVFAPVTEEESDEEESDEKGNDEEGKEEEGKEEEEKEEEAEQEEEEEEDEG